MKQRVSPTQIAIDNLIFQPTARSRSKRRPTPPASQVQTFDYVWGLLQAKWNRRKAR